MSELTQRIHRLMTPEAQSSNSREFNVMIGILNDLREDFRDVAAKVDGLRGTVGELTGDLKTVKAELGHVRGDVNKNCTKIDKLEDGQRKNTSKWSGAFKPWNGQRGDSSGPDTQAMVTLAKYVGIILAGFIAGVGSLATAWSQFNGAEPQAAQVREVREAPRASKPQSVWPEQDTNPDDDSERALKRDEL